jgi:predicted RNA binding protein YcfA (HicA-like mRNA interferase family)
VPPHLPQVSGRQLVELLRKLGYEVARQRGSHVHMRRTYPTGTHSITIPAHRALAKGTLADVLGRVSLWTGLSREELLDRL